MIHQYVRAHDRITRRDVIDLCRVSEPQAYYLLKKIVQHGDLQLVGKGRSAYYELKRSQKNAE